ncbi:histamine H1 receptor [Emydura macquarii macquarii]|uniref:histamine H1 receptor n=1 Tax=Emydura macquarii macquarii TaxID=1129001 RepID=UPI00352B8367
MCESSNATIKNSTDVPSIPLGLALGSISLITVIMNILVLYAVKIERKLHTVGNMYIVSLSVADLIVGAAVMPLNITYLLNDKWILGRPACLFWLSMDYVACTASIFSLFILCIDRYRSVQQPLKYLRYRTKTRAFIMISGAWLFSFLWIIPILGWPAFANGGKWKVMEGNCETEFSKVTWFKLLTAIVNFYVPSLLMLWFYAKIYKAVRKHCEHRELINGSFRSFSENKNVYHDKLQEKQKTCLKKPNKDTNTRFLKGSSEVPCCNVNLNFPQPKSMEAKLQLSSFDKPPKALIIEDDSKVVKLSCFPLPITQTQPGPDKVGMKYVSVNKRPCSQAPEISDTSDENTFMEGSSCKNYSDPTPELTSSAEEKTKKDFVGLSYLKSTWLRLRTQSMKGVHVNRERKAAKQLGFIMAAFMLCWIPYFVLFMVIAYCQSCCNHSFHMFTIWLGYVNSALNPFIYPLCNESFKTTFKKILHINS